MCETCRNCSEKLYVSWNQGKTERKAHVFRNQQCNR